MWKKLLFFSSNTWLILNVTVMRSSQIFCISAYLLGTPVVGHFLLGTPDLVGIHIQLELVWSGQLDNRIHQSIDLTPLLGPRHCSRNLQTKQSVPCCYNVIVCEIIAWNKILVYCNSAAICYHAIMFSV